MKKLLILLLLPLSIFAQKYELGKVTIQELQEKFCPTDTSATAAILFNIGEAQIEYNQGNFSLNTTVKTKIKIYKKEGYEWANQAVTYYIGGSSKEKVSFRNVTTYNLVDGKVVKARLKSDGEFNEKVNKFWGRKKITLPNVTEGSIIEFEYDLKSERFATLDMWKFQYNIPVFYSEYRTYIPEYYIYKPTLRGYITPKIVSETKNRIIGLGNGQTFNYNETKTTYSLSNIPALKDEAFVNNIKNYIVSVEHELTAVRFPNQPFKNYSTDWETVVKTIYDNENFGVELNKIGYFEKDIDVLIAGKSNANEKIALIFNYVKSRMNWSEFHGYSCDVGVRKAYQDKVGNVAEINLMLTAMLRYAGIEANPIIISTRGNGISLFPSRTAFDYVITGVETANKIILFDATNKYSLPDILPIRNLNWYGRLIRKNGSSDMVELMPKKNSVEVVNIMADINETGEVSGKIREQYFDYNAFIFRNNNNNISNESYIEKLEKKHSGLEVIDYEVQNSNELANPIIENYSFTYNNSVEIIGDKLYISPLLFFSLNENPFKQEKREYPVDFVYPHQDKYNILLTIPESYTVETLPEAKAIAMPDNLAKFTYNISANNNKIQLVCALDINEAIILPDYYETLKEFFKEFISKQNEKIILKKL